MNFTLKRRAEPSQGLLRGDHVCQSVFAVLELYTFMVQSETQMLAKTAYVFGFAGILRNDAMPTSLTRILAEFTFLCFLESLQHVAAHL